VRALRREFFFLIGIAIAVCIWVPQVSANPHPHDKETDDGVGLGDVDLSNNLDLVINPELVANPTATGGTGTGGEGGQGGSSGGNRFDSDSAFFMLSTTAPNIDGCITGKGVGLGGDGGGGLIQWATLNIPCFLNEVGEAERHVETRALLKCAAKPFRNAIAYNHPKKERQAKCITHVTRVWKEEIDYLRELVEANGGVVDGLARLEKLLTPK